MIPFLLKAPPPLERCANVCTRETPRVGISAESPMPCDDLYGPEGNLEEANSCVQEYSDRE